MIVMATKIKQEVEKQLTNKRQMPQGNRRRRVGERGKGVRNTLIIYPFKQSYPEYPFDYAK
jgi:hypothetical protein